MVLSVEDLRDSMTDIEVTSTSEEGYTVTSVVDGWELIVDATGENGPTTQQVLAGDYASCFLPAFRVGAEREGYDDVGKIELQVDANLGEDDELTNIAFHLAVQASLEDDADAIVTRAKEGCHIHNSLRPELHADITVADDAF
jgi:organic hydroperoxide reductase OsmC/OhrA